MLWSIAMIVIEMIETRFPWRGLWQDWLTVGGMAVTYWFAALLISGASLTPELLAVTLPQAVLSLLLYPLIARMVAGLDRFRLSRARRIN